MEDNTNTLDKDDLIIENSDTLSENEYFKSKPVTIDDGYKIEFIAEKYDDSITSNDIFQDLQTVEEKLCGTEKLSNHADSLDYTISVASGIFCGLIDSFFVGEFSFERGESWSKDIVEKMVKKIAKQNGSKSEDLSGSIRFLEKKFGAPSDSVTDLFGGGKQHHLRDFAHHPNIMGLLCSMMTQFTGNAYGTDTNGNFIIVKIENKAFIGKDLPEKILFGFIYWVFHMISDIAGSSSTVSDGGSGTGLPGPFLSLLKEISSLPIFKNVDKNGNKNFSVWISKLFNGTLLAEHDEKGNIIRDTVKPFDLRAEIGVASELGRQAIPVIINECIVRGFYFFRQLNKEFKTKKIVNFDDLKKIEIPKILPFKNRTIIRMLTISKGVFTAFDAADAADAAIRSGGINAAFLLRINFVGATSFFITACIDIGMGIKKYYKEKNYDSPKNLELVRLYKNNSLGLSKLLNDLPKASVITGPLLLHFDEKLYNRTPKKKIMFVDIDNHLKLTYQESRQSTKGVLSLFEEYKNYEFEKKNKFYRFAYQVNKEINDLSDENNYFIWNSLHKLSNRKDKIFESENRNFNVLLDEIRICNPDAVVFMTGKKYDAKIKSKFNGKIIFNAICKKNNYVFKDEEIRLPSLGYNKIALISSDYYVLPKNTYRIMKPSSIFFRKKSIMKWLKYFITVEQYDFQINNVQKTDNVKIPKKLIIALSAIIFSLIFLFFGLKYYFNTKAELNITNSNIESTTDINITPITLNEIKSPLFIENKSNFIDNDEASIWLDSISEKIKVIIQSNPHLKFKINGYVADFPNFPTNIDDSKLSRKRAETIKNELVNRGISDEVFIVNPVGKTSRWGKNINENRAVTIESVE